MGEGEGVDVGGDVVAGASVDAGVEVVAGASAGVGDAVIATSEGVALDRPLGVGVVITTTAFSTS